MKFRISNLYSFAVKFNADEYDFKIKLARAYNEFCKTQIDGHGYLHMADENIKLKYDWWVCMGMGQYGCCELPVNYAMIKTHDYLTDIKRTRNHSDGINMLVGWVGDQLSEKTKLQVVK